MTPSAVAADWATLSSLATGAGTLVLAVATFAAVRSANRSARIAEVALQEQRRPILAPSRLNDPVQKLIFVDGYWVTASGGHGVAEHVDGVVYLALSLRNVGSGIGVCQGWTAMTGLGASSARPTTAPLEQFRVQSRDLYVPGGGIGMWQGALRNPDDPVRAAIAEAIDTRQPLHVELLYSDQIGRQRTITRFGLVPAGDDAWFANMSRHWYLDWDGPRPESDILTATAVMQEDYEAAEQRAAARSALAIEEEPGAQAHDSAPSDRVDHTPRAPSEPVRSHRRD